MSEQQPYQIYLKHREIRQRLWDTEKRMRSTRSQLRVLTKDLSIGDRLFLAPMTTWTETLIAIQILRVRWLLFKLRVFSSFLPAHLRRML